MEIRPYDFDRSLSGQFVQLRVDLWRGAASAPGIEPERLLSNLDRTFAFHAKPGNSHRHFAALEGERLIGHVSALVNRELTDGDGTPIGALGFFECAGDEPVARALLDAGVAWLDRSGHGARIWAPVDFDIWHGYRFRTRGTSSRPLVGDRWNEGWYPAFFERYGFDVRERWESVEVCGAEWLQQLTAGSEARLRERLADGYRIRSVDPASDFERVHDLVMDAFSGFLGFTPLTFTEFEDLFGPVWHGTDLRLSNVVLDPLGEPVGFALVYPDGDRVVFFMIGITQREIAKRHGLGRAAFCDCMRRILAAGHERVVFALMSRGSGARALTASPMGRVQTEHTLYQLSGR